MQFTDKKITMTNLTHFEFHPSIIKTDEKGQKYAWLDFYYPDKTTNYKAFVTFYLADEGLDEADIIRYQQQVESKTLIAIEVNDKNFDSLSIAHTVLHCKPNEIEKVLKTFERMIADAEYSFIWIDFQNFLPVLESSKNIYFRQGYAKGNDSIEVATQQIFNSIDLPKTKAVLTCAIVPSDTGFETVGQMDDIMENAVSNEVDFYHAVNFEDENPYWQNDELGCWLGVVFVC